MTNPPLYQHACESTGRARKGILFAAAAGSLLIWQSECWAATGRGSVEYNRDIRPILSENCFACHGPDSAARKANLRLDSFDTATAPRKESTPAVVPRKPDESELVRRVFATDEDDVMPPPKTHKVLKPEQKELLKRWIAEGAAYEPHWSLIAPKRPPLPAVKNKRWARNPIDHFVLARLEEVSLKPGAEADRRALIRRVSLDLTGLPPKPELVEAFVRDRAPDAYEKLVDRLMASPQWGEHRARYWLDAARYADTHGIHFDNYREVWAYRDWVISAFNENKSFDQFTLEQLAGDLLSEPSLEQRIASGFNRCNITTSEGGAIDEEYLVLYTRDRTETTSQVWLGLTAGCAVCHDHKYDPLSQREFYAMSAFFNNTTQKAMDGNVKDTPPIVVVPKAEDRARWEALTSEKAVAKARIEDRRKAASPDFDEWLTRAPAQALAGRLPKDEPVLHAPLSESEQTMKLTIDGRQQTFSLPTNSTWQEGAVAAKAFTVSAAAVPVLAEAGDFERDQPMTYAAWVRLSEARDGAVFGRMDEDDGFRGWDVWLEQGKPGTHIINKWPDNAIKVVAKKALEANRWFHICVTYDGTSKVSGVKVYIDGEVQDLETQADKLSDTIRTKVPFKIGQRNKSSPVEKAGVQDLRMYSRVLTRDEVKELGNATRMSWLAAKQNDRTKAETDELLDRWLSALDEKFQAANRHLAEVNKEEREIKSRGTVAFVMSEREAQPEAHVLFRGEYDKRRDKVAPGTPAALPPMPDELPRNRVGFAKWLLMPEHPLTARVTVNRFWQELFGTGIVRTSGDFGVTGEMPSHPELLDWLAVEFRESGWDVKRFFKLLVTSATYRQEATTTPEKLARDPQNRLLSRAPRFRMDGEMIRDCALAASGLLVEKIGGPSVRPYQPDGVWEAVAMIGSDTRQYKRDSGENLYRRSLYTFWKRAAPPASMDIFNAPNRETCAVRRERTDTPLQALVTLNDPQFVEAARNLAERALKEGGSEATDRLSFMSERLLARRLRADEKRVVSASLDQLLKHYQCTPKDAEELVAVGESKADPSLDKPTLAAYTMAANMMMNLDEVLNK